jgi:hypothetical protein
VEPALNKTGMMLGYDLQMKTINLKLFNWASTDNSF